MIVSGRDKSIKIWNYETIQCINTLLGHEQYVLSVINISSKSSKLAAAKIQQ